MLRYATTAGIIAAHISREYVVVVVVGALEVDKRETADDEVVAAFFGDVLTSPASGQYSAHVSRADVDIKIAAASNMPTPGSVWYGWSRRDETVTDDAVDALDCE